MKIINPSILRHLFPWILWKGNGDGSRVFLTFDDGPHPRYTTDVLRILNKEKVQATFFLTGENMLLHPGIVSEIAGDGHTIGNHGFSHRILAYKKRAFIQNEIDQCNRIAEKITGSRPLFFRPPHGKFDARFQSIISELKMRMVIWSLLTYDYMETDPALLKGRLTRHLHPGAVVVFHDGHRNAPFLIRNLSALIETIRNENFTFGCLADISAERKR